MSTQLSTPEHGLDTGGAPPTRARRRRWIVWALVAAVVAVAVTLVVARDRGTRSAGPTSSTVTSQAPTSSAPSTSVTTIPTTPPPSSTAVWPVASSSTRYTDPVAAARSFAVDFLGFVDPVMGSYEAGDPNSGEVTVRAKPNGAVTTVFVRMLSNDGNWWVLGAATDEIQVGTPHALDTVSSPLHVSGTSTAFEATVQVQIRADGVTTPLADTTVMGGSMGSFAPFAADVPYLAPAAPSGSLVLFTRSMEDGNMWQASVLRVHFASGTWSPEQAIADQLATTGTAYMGTCSNARLPNDVGAYCSLLSEDRGATRVYGVGPTFSEIDTWMLLDQSSGGWVVTATAPARGAAPPW